MHTEKKEYITIFYTCVSPIHSFFANALVYNLFNAHGVALNDGCLLLRKVIHIYRNNLTYKVIENSYNNTFYNANIIYKKYNVMNYIGIFHERTKYSPDPISDFKLQTVTAHLSGYGNGLIRSCWYYEENDRWRVDYDGK